MVATVVMVRMMPAIVPAIIIVGIVPAPAEAPVVPTVVAVIVGIVPTVIPGVVPSVVIPIPGIAQTEATITCQTGRIGEVTIVESVVVAIGIAFFVTVSLFGCSGNN